MSKLDAVRALREARYAQEQKQAKEGRPRARVQAPVAPAADPAANSAAGTAKTTKARKPAAKAPTPAEAGVDEERCGHRNISGRTCTRERGHAAKTHRYS